MSILSLVCAAMLLSCAVANAEPGGGHITFSDIAKRPDSGIHYQRVPSSNDALWNKLRSKPVVTLFDFGTSGPVKSRGVPGVAVLDYDRDGDLDIFVTNGPGKPNSLYSSQLKQGGGLTFVDVAKAAGVDAPEMDGTGVCYGDVNNDGYDDLFVVSAGGGNKLFMNNGNGTFTDVSMRSDAGGRAPYPFSVGCSMGDVNGDGLLDIVIGNTSTSWDSPLSPAVQSQLLLNKGNGVFQDVSAESGITHLAGFLPQQAGATGVTWGIAMVDYDQDGDVDIVMAQDQSNYPVGGTPGVPGLVHVLQNDGTGHFKDVSVEAGTNMPGAWMSLSFGDINSDGYMDMFIPNMGDYLNSQYFPYQIGEMASRWFLGHPDATFSKEVITDQNATALGWGTVMADVDNDGSTDIVYLGGMDGGPLVDVSNPGIILMNDGNGNMTVDKRALATSGPVHRDIQSLAQGDLNNDGFVDLISVSDFDIPGSVPLVRYSAQYGSALDDTAYYVPTFTPVGPGQFKWAGYQFDNGTLAIDVNSADNGNGWVKVDLLGTVGILAASRSNRDGVGAVVKFTPKHGKTAMHPVVAGDSFASQSALTAQFGLGKSSEGTVDVLWPGGTRNRFYGARKGETLRLPEIPCSYAAHWNDKEDYRECVNGALRSLVHRRLLSEGMRDRLYESAMRAYTGREDDDHDGKGRDDEDHSHEQ